MRLPSDATLLVVDDDKPAPALPDARGQADDRSLVAALLDVWLASALPTLWTARRADRLHSRSPPEDPVAIGHVGTPFLPRWTASAFAGTQLERDLTERGCTTLVVCGSTIDGDVEATVRHAADLGFRIFVVADACAARPVVDQRGRAWSAHDVHALALGRLEACGARIVDARTAWRAAKSAGWGRR